MRGYRRDLMKRVIINVDDFGLDEATNEVIKTLILNQKIKSTTILTKRDKNVCEDAFTFAKANSNVGYGLHLDLDEYFLFDEHGLWGRDEKHIISTYNEIIASQKEKIIADITQQFQTFKEYGVPISHVDGHHHIHLFKEILVILLPIMKQYQVDKMRFVNDFYLTPQHLNEILNLLNENHIKTPDQFIAGVNIHDSELLQTCECMVHVFFGANDYQTEADVLLTETRFEPFKVISYHEL